MDEVVTRILLVDDQVLYREAMRSGVRFVHVEDLGRLRVEGSEAVEGSTTAEYIERVA